MNLMLGENFHTLWTFRASFKLGQEATLDLSVIGHLKGDTVSPLCLYVFLV